MSDNVTRLPVAGTPAIAATVATAAVHPGSLLAAAPMENGRSLSDLAHDTMIAAIDTAQLEEGVTAAATDIAVRILLLAAAELLRPDELGGRERFVSTALIAAMTEALHDLTAPPTDDEASTRLDAVFRARGAHGAALARSWFAACKPQPCGDGDETPPAAA